MVKITFINVYKYVIFLLTGLVIGFLIGLTGMSLLVSYRIDQYHQRINYLDLVIEEKNTQLDQLEKSINKKRYIVKEIDIVILNEDDTIDKLGLEKHIREKYNKLLGQEVKSINPDLAAEVIDKRIMRLSGKTYKLAVDKILLSETIKIWVQVEVEAETGFNM